ncbi:MAG TPA: STAS domain-containing protein [Actinomycetes bacterium]|jgi:anti-sigma B factor antagonist|nr:STAS domain-containing protein [Actinomycetes bacterium]
MALLSQSAVTPSQGYAIVTVQGDIDVHTADQLWQYLSYLMGQGHHHIVLDLAGMILIDSAGVDAIARASARTLQDGGDLVLRSAGPPVAELMELAGLTHAQTHDLPAGG